MKTVIKAAALLAAALAFSPISLWSQTGEKKYTEASELTLTGKLFTDTPNPYHRVDTLVHKGFTKSENLQVRESSGIAVAFRTNTSSIYVKTVWGYASNPTNTNAFSARGYDLYIKTENGWMFAGAGAASLSKLDKPLLIAENLTPGYKECLLYLPTYSEEYSVQIGIDKDADIQALENPFRHRIAIFGSSYTHGSSTSRAGMTYPAQFSRSTGLQLLSLGCSGNSKLQSYFADVLAAAKVDAIILDAFSNPSAQMIEERLFPFIEKLQSAHPDIPIIFQKTIFRERRMFNTKAEQYESEKMAMADSLMSIACKKYKNIYYIEPTATSPDHSATVDGVHPSNYGYTLWAESIEKPVKRILKKYGIK